MEISKEQSRSLIAVIYGRASAARQRVSEIEAQIAQLQVQLIGAKYEQVRAEQAYESACAILEG